MMVLAMGVVCGVRGKAGGVVPRNPKRGNDKRPHVMDVYLLITCYLGWWVRLPPSLGVSGSQSVQPSGTLSTNNLPGPAGFRPLRE